VEVFPVFIAEPLELFLYLFWHILHDFEHLKNIHSIKMGPPLVESFRTNFPKIVLYRQFLSPNDTIYIKICSNRRFCRLGTSTGTIHDGLGNYSLSVKCSWLIDAPNTSITLHLDEFATECGWDHLYIFDGDSVNSPLLAVFSGLMYKGDYSIRRIPEVVATSGSALVHFFSDDAFNMSGFNMTYRLNACPSKISAEGIAGVGFGPEEHMSGLTFRSSPGFDLGTRGF
jgi:hypothetical protein